MTEKDTKELPSNKDIEENPAIANKGDLDFPTIVILILFTYWYLFPQKFFPILQSFRIAPISVAICIIYLIFTFRFEKFKLIKGDLIALFILEGMFLVSLAFVSDTTSAKYYITEHFHNISVGLVFYLKFQKMNKLKLFFGIMIFYATFTAFVGIKEGGLIWAHTFLQDENQISAFMAMMLPLTIFYSFCLQKKSGKVLCYIGAGMQVALIVRSFSRGGFVALIAVAICIFFYSRNKLIILALLIVGCGFIFNYAPEKFFTEVKSIEQGTDEATAGGRVRMWERAWRMFKARPIFGHGIAQFPTENRKFLLPGEIEREADRLVCHSNWFQILSELGALGLLCYLAIWKNYFKTWYIINKSLKNNSLERVPLDERIFYKNISTGLAISMVGFIVAGTFINIMIFAYYYNFIFFMMALRASWLSRIN